MNDPGLYMTILLPPGQAFERHVASEAFSHRYFAGAEDNRHAAHARHVLPPAVVFRRAACEPGLGSLPRGALGGSSRDAGVVDIRIFSGVVFTMSEPKPVSTPCTFMSYILTFSAHGFRPPSSCHLPALARDRGDRIAQRRDPRP